MEIEFKSKKLKDFLADSGLQRFTGTRFKKEREQCFDELLDIINDIDSGKELTEKEQNRYYYWIGKIKVN